MKNEKKIRRMLGTKYHLCTDNEGWWVLYRYYNDADLYFSPDNKAVMSSDTHTEEDLIKYLKKHGEWDLHIVIMNCNFVISLLVLFLSIVNVFLRITTLRGIIFGWLLMSLTISIINNCVMHHNSNVTMREFQEHLAKLSEKNEDSK